MRGKKSNVSLGTGLILIAILMSIALSASTSFAAGKRVALVVGNGAYQSVPQLPNPRNDAALVSETLRKQGFEVVTAVDLSRIELEKAVERYARALNGAEISLFYYSGHGIEVGGENRIVPVDATLGEPQDLETQTYSLQTILLTMQSSSKAQLIYLDACRDNPFNDRTFLLGLDDTEKPAGKGLAEQKGAIGSLIAYATEPGKVALDGTGANSPFTDAVIRHSFTQDTDVQSALMKVTEEVWEATQQSQRPWINSTLVKPLFLKGGPAKPLVTYFPVMTKTLAELQLAESTREVVTGPVTIGVGPQAVFTGDTQNELPGAKVFKLMQMPLAGTLTVDEQVLSEGSLVDYDKFKSLHFEPSIDVDIHRQSSAAVPLVPDMLVDLAAIAENGAAIPMQLRIQQNMHACDVLAAEPLDLQGLGKGVELEKIDVTQALAACQQAAETHSQTLRYVYLSGRVQLAAGNISDGLALVQQAADLGYVRAIHQLGLMAFNGQGMAKNRELANNLFQQAADKGDPHALLSLGRNLVKGQGIEPNAKRGIELMKRAAELGSTDALDEMGGLYLYGGALKANAKRATRFLEASVSRSAKQPNRKKAAFAGYQNAATDMGRHYFEGNGVRRDLAQAAKWFELGVQLGNQGGAADLSWIFAEGDIALRNPAKAVWYTSLALGSEGSRDDGSLLKRLAGLPDDAKRLAMRDFVNLVGPCATQTVDGIDGSLLELSRKAWLQKQSENGLLVLPEIDGTFGAPDGRSMDDELRYWNLVNSKNSDVSYLAYLEHFPDGVFADIARGRLGGLLQRLKLEPNEAACAPPPAKAKKSAKKPEPVRLLKQDPPKVKKAKPKPPPVVRKPVKKAPPPVKRPKRPKVVVEEEIFEEEEEPEVVIPRRRRLPRFPRIPPPQREETCPNGDC